MPPELDAGYFQKILQASNNGGRMREDGKLIMDSGKFVRQGLTVWAEPVAPHKVIAEVAGFTNPQDAGFYKVVGKDKIGIGGVSLTLELGGNSKERQKTLEIAQEAAGDKVEIIKKEGNLTI